jgi:hypothetical protein
MTGLVSDSINDLTINYAIYDQGVVSQKKTGTQLLKKDLMFLIAIPSDNIDFMHNMLKQATYSPAHLSYNRYMDL